MNKSSRASSQVRTAPCGGNVEVLSFGVCGREKCARVPQITQKCVIRWMSLQKRPAWYQRTSPLFPAPNLQPSHQKPWLPQTFSLYSPLPDPAISNPSLLRGFVSPITAPSARCVPGTPRNVAAVQADQRPLQGVCGLTRDQHPGPHS